MLSIFPDLLTFWLVVPLILRVTAGLIFIYFGVSTIWKKRERSILATWVTPAIEIIGGVLLVLGFLTQLAALILLVFVAGTVYAKIRRPNIFDNTLEFYILLLAVLFSLLFLGSGFFAIDLPL